MTKPKVWEMIKHEVLYQGRRKLVNETYTTPDGGEFTYELVISQDTVGVMPVTNDGHVILVKQFRPGIRTDTLEFPGGQIDYGEDIYTAASRELLEETGYKGDLVYLGRYWNCAYSTNYKHLFLAKNCVKIQDQKLDHGEFAEIVLLPLETVAQLKFSNSVSDMLLAYKGLEELGLLTVKGN